MTSRKSVTLRGRHGVTALIAMLFLMLITTLTLAMFHVAAGNVQTSANFSDLTKAQEAAESGLRWTSYRFNLMARPREMAGTITPAIASAIWNKTDGFRDRLAANIALTRDLGNAPVGVTAGASAPEVLVQGVIARIAQTYDVTVEEPDVARETVSFKLPRAVAG